MTVTGPELLYKSFVECFNRGDLYGLSQLYGSVAVLRTEDGATSYGRHQIADTLRAYIKLGGTMYLATRFKLQTGDTALMSAKWTIYAGTDEQPVVLTGISAEVCRRVDTDEWVFVCSNWFAGPTDQEMGPSPKISPGNVETWA